MVNPGAPEGELPFPRCSGRRVAFPQVFQKRSRLSPSASEGALPFLFLLEKFEDTKEIIRKSFVDHCFSSSPFSFSL
jgi:hypothetical protein